MRNKIQLLLFFLLFGILPTQAQWDTDTDSLSTADSTLTDSVQETALLPWPQSVQHALARLLEQPMFETSQVGISVYDLTADSILFRHNDRQLMRPASTMKVITAIAAIDLLGGSYQFKTELCYTGKIENGVLQGDLYCVGGFDPRFNNDDMRAFVESLHKMGVDTIRGTLYADKSMKDDKIWGEGWCWDDDNPTLSPLLISRKDEFVERFRSELRESGIYMDGFTGTKRKPADANCIVRRFHTMDQILMRMLKESDNLYAESMWYQIAAATGDPYASAADVRRQINRLITKIGLNPKRYYIADGSGLSLYNYVTPELEVQLLRYAWKNQNIYIHLYPSLPIAGTDGTLKSRMRHSFTKENVHAKTGTLTGISSLAGYCTASNGHLLCFSIINQGIRHTNSGRQFQDKVCTILCQP